MVLELELEAFRALRQTGVVLIEDFPVHGGPFLIAEPTEAQRPREIGRHQEVGVGYLLEVVGLKLGQGLAQEVVVPPREVAAANHILKLVEEVLPVVGEERREEVEELGLVEHTLDIAREALHEVFIGALLVEQRQPQLLEKLTLTLREVLELGTRELRQVVMMVMVVPVVRGYNDLGDLFLSLLGADRLVVILTRYLSGWPSLLSRLDGRHSLSLD